MSACAPIRRTRAAAALALVLALVLPLAPAPAARAAEPHASLPAIERRVMCVTCKIPLEVAQSVQAERERAFIAGLIAEGQSESQIERELVSQYGPAVLALPSTHGFDLTAYLVPLLAIVALLALLITLLPRWRRRARAQAAEREAASALALSDADRARLDADLARFER